MVILQEQPYFTGCIAEKVTANDVSVPHRNTFKSPSLILFIMLATKVGAPY